MQNGSEDTGRTPIHLSVVVFGLLVAGSAAWGEVPVTIVNAGFEDPVLADGDWTSYATGWDSFEGGDIGVWNVTVAVGNSLSYAGLPGYQVQLLAGGTVIAQDDDSLAIPEGEFDNVVMNAAYAHPVAYGNGPYDVTIDGWLTLDGNGLSHSVQARRGASFWKLRGGENPHWETNPGTRRKR
jgi:hypothetical protein